MEQVCMLTTVDNPYSPFDDFTSWLLFDSENEHNTCGILSRTLDLTGGLTDDMSDKEKDDAIENAIDTIIANDFLDIFKKVTQKK